MINNFFKKISLKDNEELLIINIPNDVKNIFLNSKIDFKIKKENYDRIIIFVLKEKEELNNLINKYKFFLKKGGRFYFAYPKKISKKYKEIKNFLDRDIIWKEVLKNNWRPVSLYSFDDDWSVMLLKENS